MIVLMTALLISAALTLASAVAFSSEATRFEKLRSVLAHLGIQQERSYYDSLHSLDGTQTRAGYETILKYVDPGNHLARYTKVDDKGITVFQDRDTKRINDFSLNFKASSRIPSDPYGLLAALRHTRSNRAGKPLHGLRIA